MIEAALAQAAVSFLVTKAVEGVAQTAGVDAYKAALEKLKGFFSYKFAGKKELSEVQDDPSALTSLVAEQAAKDSGFKGELEALVSTLQELIAQTGHTDTSYTNVDTIANINVGSASGSNVSGRDAIVGNQISGGHNHIGGDQRGSTFR
jgi:hypothetical protein